MAAVVVQRMTPQGQQPVIPGGIAVVKGGQERMLLKQGITGGKPALVGQAPGAKEDVGEEIDLLTWKAE